MPTVYLCGPINGRADAECKGWRAEASLALLRAGWTVLDPMRRDFRGVEGDHARAIVHGDLFDVQASDWLLVNAERPSWGTAMEVVYARTYPLRKRVVAFGAGPYPSPWLLYHCDRLFPVLADALAYLTGAA